MSLHELRRREPVRVSAGSLWQDPLAMELSGGASGRHVVSPRSRTRAVSVAYIANEDASLAHTEENLSLKCLREACADAHATFEDISFEQISLGTTDTLHSFYNAGKCGHARTHARTLPASTLAALRPIAQTLTRPFKNVPPPHADVAVVEMSDTFCQPSLFYHLGARESFSMTNNIILFCYKQDSDVQAVKVPWGLQNLKCLSLKKKGGL